MVYVCIQIYAYVPPVMPRLIAKTKTKQSRKTNKYLWINNTFCINIFLSFTLVYMWIYFQLITSFTLCTNTWQYFFFNRYTWHAHYFQFTQKCHLEERLIKIYIYILDQISKWKKENPVNTFCQCLNITILWKWRFVIVLRLFDIM